MEEQLGAKLAKQLPPKADGVPVLEPALEIMRMMLNDMEAYAEYITMLHDDPLPPNIARYRRAPRCASPWLCISLIACWLTPMRRDNSAPCNLVSVMAVILKLLSFVMLELKIVPRPAVEDEACELPTSSNSNWLAPSLRKPARQPNSPLFDRRGML